MVAAGTRFFPLTITAEDLISTYDVEAEVLAQYGVNTGVGDTIKLTVSAVDVVAASTGAYAIDADGLNNLAMLEIIFIVGSMVAGRGGSGGAGGLGDWDAEPPATDLSLPGSAGAFGGNAIRLGCPTTLSGEGLISAGHGAGGGGGGGSAGFGTRFGGGGGGGGAPLGQGGVGGPGGSAPGIGGTTALVTVKGDGGLAGGAQAGDGGDGGDSSPSPAQAGLFGTKIGGAAGADGIALVTQGFSHVADPGVIIEGSIT